MAQNQNQDPRSRAATILPDSGMDALSVGFKRKGIENVQQQQKKADERYNLELLNPKFKEGWKPDHEIILESYNNVSNYAADLMQEATQKGVDPRLLPGYATFKQLEAKQNQAAESSLQQEAYYKAAKDDARANVAKYRRGYEQELDNWMATPLFERGDPPDPDEFFDYQAGLLDEASKLKASTEAYSYLDKGTGIISEGTDSAVNEMRLAELAFSMVDPKVKGNKYFKNISMDLKDLQTDNPEEYKRLEDRSNQMAQKLRSQGIDGWNVTRQKAFEIIAPTEYHTQTRNTQYSASAEQSGKDQLSAEVVAEKLTGIALGNPEMYKEPDPDHSFTISGPDGKMALEWTDVSTGEGLMEELDSEGKTVKANIGVILRNPETGEIIPISQRQLSKMQNSKNFNISDYPVKILGKDEFIPFMMETWKTAGEGVGVKHQDIVKHFRDKGITFEGGTTQGLEKSVPADKQGPTPQEYAQSSQKAREYMEVGVTNANLNPSKAAELLNEAKEKIKAANGGKLPYMTPKEGFIIGDTFIDGPGGKTKVFDGKDIIFEQSGENVKVTTVSKTGVRNTVTVTPDEFKKLIEAFPNVQGTQSTTKPASQPATKTINQNQFRSMSIPDRQNFIKSGGKVQ